MTNQEADIPKYKKKDKEREPEEEKQDDFEEETEGEEGEGSDDETAKKIRKARAMSRVLNEEIKSETIDKFAQQPRQASGQ